MLEWLFGRRRLASRKLGVRGERRAAWFYRLRGYRVLERNARHRAAEADLVLRRGRILVIAEVKARQSNAAGEGHEAVGVKKREKLIRMGDVYAARYPDCLLRYDIVSLTWTGRRFIVAHYPDAFRPMADPQRPWIWRG